MLMWTDGEAQPIDVPGWSKSLVDLNSAGVAVGSSHDSNGSDSAWVYRDGVATKLPGGDNAVAFAINDAGVIVGRRGHVPVRWDSPTSDPVALAVPDGAPDSWATGIDDDGTIVGLAVLANGHQRNYQWRTDASVVPLEPPAGYSTGIRVGVAVSIRNGWVSAYTTPAGVDSATEISTFDTALWNLRTGDVRVVPVRSTARPTRDGWLVGDDGKRHAVLRSESGTLVLPELAPGNGRGPSNPTFVSEDGRMAAGRANNATGTAAVVWRCQ